MTSNPSPSNSAVKTSALERPRSFAEMGDDATRIISSGKADGRALPQVGTAIVSTAPKAEFHATQGVPPTSSNADRGQATSSSLLPIGTRVAEFEITRVIGQGGFGVVYEAWDHTLERVIAIKEYMPFSLANRQNDGSVAPSSDRHRETFDMGMRSFINEARLLAQFDHPALLKVYRFWQERGTTYMVMPCYRGETLKEALASRKDGIDQDWLLGIVDGVTQALAVMHRANCYHRDIAPDNVMLLENSGLPVVLDFGAARRVITDRTQAITVILKPGYAPIEQYAETPDMSQGAWTDIYAMSAVIHVVITGRSPPPSVARILNDRYVPLAGNAELQKRFGNHILAAVDSGLAVRPEGRPQSIAKFRSMLKLQSASDTAAAKPARTISSNPSEPPAYSWGTPKQVSVTSLPAKKTPKSMMAATATTLAIAAAGAWWWTSNSTSNSGAKNAPASQAANVIAPSAAPPQAALVAIPPAAQTVSASQSLSSLLVSAKPGFEVTARPIKPEARIGKDKLGFQIQSTKPGFVYVYLLSSGGDMLLLFPNALDKRNRIESGTPMSLPKPSWAMDAGGPPGTDEFVVLVSEHERNLKTSGIQYDGVFGQFPTKILEALELARGNGTSPLLGVPVCPGGGSCTDNYGAASFKIVEK